jgi:NAD(P)H-dependent FMN reductase
MRIVIISSSMNPHSLSEKIAGRCQQVLSGLGVVTQLLSLKDHVLPPFGTVAFQDAAEYQFLHGTVLAADGLVLASPVYNWSSCAEMKKFVEYVGSTDGSVRGAFYDKVVTLVHAAGLPHSYMAGLPLANSLMLDFKCVINPYSVYIHNRHWENEVLTEDAEGRIQKAMQVMAELTFLFSQRTYCSDWEV